MPARLLALLLWAPVAAGQPPTSYLPLDLGNRWTYAFTVEPPGAPADTIVGAERVIETTELINDTLYTTVPYPFAIARQLREDGEGRLWGRIHERDELVFDVTQPHGGTYLVPDPFDPNSGLSYEVTVRRDVTVETFAGRFGGGLRFSFDVPRSVDDEIDYVLVPGLGVATASTAILGSTALYAAEVRGRVVTETGDAPEASPSATARPNPFASFTTVRLPSGAGGIATVTAHDLLGRRLATLLDEPVGPAGRDVVWNASGLPAGIYLVRIRQGDRVQTLRVVRAR